MSKTKLAGNDDRNPLTILSADSNDGMMMYNDSKPLRSGSTSIFKFRRDVS